MSSEASGNIPYLVISEDLKDRLRVNLEESFQLRSTWREFVEEHGGKNSVTDGYCCRGVQFESSELIPEGWTRPKKNGIPYTSAPKSNSKDYKEFCNLPSLVDNRNAFAKIVGTNGFMDVREGGLYSLQVGAVQFIIDKEDIFILLAPIPSSFKGKLEDTQQYKKFPFSDVREITWSEYFKLKEQAGDLP